jgi:glycerol-3-phosphate dehydrogenase
MQDEEGQVVGATVRDALGRRSYDVHARQVINATGPFADGIRHMSDPAAPKMIMARWGCPLVPCASLILWSS